VFSRQTRKLRVLFLLADFLLVWLALEAAYATRSSLPLERIFYLEDNVKALLILFSQIAWITAGFWSGAYDRLGGFRANAVFRQTLRQSALAALTVVLFDFLRRLDLSRPFLGLFFVYAVVFLLCFRLLALAIMPRLSRGLSPTRIVYVAGDGQAASQVARLLLESAHFGLQFAGFLGSHPRAQASPDLPFPVFPISSLSELLHRQVIDEVVFAGSSEELATWEDAFLLCDEVGVRTRISVDFFPHVNSRIYLDRLGPLPLLTFAGAPHDEFRLVLKRAIDVVLSLAALSLLFPFLLFVFLAIRLTSPGPAIFRQERCGLNGRRFILFKFRTMVADAEARKQALAHLNVKSTAFKIPNDPRLTPLGRWLRKFSIDELPQLWNILRGEMSIVGPRPPVPEEVDQYERWQRRRLRMRPGLTCLWALAGRDDLDFEEWMRLDLAYIDRWSLMLDWSIILRTIPHVLTGRGAS
jgi:exopolysaccharide biosynthesis polyprenyl glycosylphosphotransferase